MRFHHLYFHSVTLRLLLLRFFTFLIPLILSSTLNVFNVKLLKFIFTFSQVATDVEDYCLCDFSIQRVRQLFLIKRDGLNLVDNQFSLS